MTTICNGFAQKQNDVMFSMCDFYGTTFLRRFKKCEKTSLSVLVKFKDAFENRVFLLALLGRMQF